MEPKPLPCADLIRATERHPGRPDLIALSVAYARARRAVNRDGAGAPSRRPSYVAYLHASENERLARRAYFDAVKAVESPQNPNQQTNA